MKLKTFRVLNYEEIEEAKRLDFEPPKEIREEVSLWFKVEDMKYAYVTNNDNINIHFNNNDFITVPKTIETLELLDNYFNKHV